MNLAILWGTALWLGIITSVSPCPLATNLSATAYLSRRVDSRRRAVAGMLAYTLGRVAAYVLIAGILAFGLTSAPTLSHGLQRWMAPLLGPLLLLTAMVLLGLITLPFQSTFTSQRAAEKWATRGLLGEFILGFLFALSFCPVSAALFFGSLIPLALDCGRVATPVILYGIGTAAPVTLCSLVMVFSANSITRLVGDLTRIQPWIFRITGGLLLIAGLYLTARDTLSILP